MRTIYLLLIALIFMQTSLAGTHMAIPAKLTLKVDIKQQIREHEKLSDREQIANTISVLTKNHSWIMLGRQQSYSDHGLFVVLSKLEKADKQTATLKLLVLDIDKKRHIISEPELVVTYGKQGKMTIDGNNQQLQVSVLVNKESV